MKTCSLPRILAGPRTKFINLLSAYLLLALVLTARDGVFVPLNGPVLVGEPVTFTVQGDLSDTHWDLGNGSRADGASVIHTYQEPGVYHVVTGSSSAIVRVHTPETVHLPQVLLDTDAHNEVDDQNYIGYALFSNLDVLAITSIHNGPWRKWQGGEESEAINYREILNILDLSRRSGLLDHRPEKEMPQAFHGAKDMLVVPSSGNWLDTVPLQTDASEAILAAARGASPDNPVWVLPVGPCSNIASAILQAREEGLDLQNRIRIIWLGGGPDGANANTFNGNNDPWSVYVTAQSGLDFWVLLENPTGSSILFNQPDDYSLYPDIPLGDYLRNDMRSYFEEKIPGRKSKALYDLATVSIVIGNYLGNPWLTSVEPSQLLGPDQEYRWKKVDGPTNVYVIRDVDEEAMKTDFFKTLNGSPSALPPKE
jgi:inosine-uridine nucleoside N-ribohydrolase